jgi:hypothetical protein
MAHRSAWLVLLLVASAAHAQRPAQGAPTTRPTSQPATQPAAVVIERLPPEVETRTFDPKNPPATMPALREGEAAVTHSEFTCQTLIAGDVVDQVRSANGCTTTVRVTSVTTTIKLYTVIWLPVGGSRRLTAHEEAHRQIDQRFYDEGEVVARRLSTALVGQLRAGKGLDCDAAGQAAVKEAGAQLCGEYMAAIREPARRVGELFDEITDHGRNRIREHAAIQRAIDRQKRESGKSATTKPAPHASWID